MYRCAKNTHLHMWRAEHFSRRLQCLLLRAEAGAVQDPWPNLALRRDTHLHLERNDIHCFCTDLKPLQQLV